jgi:hypothetical protein
MHTLKTTTIVSAALISLLLSACGGSGSPMSNQGGSSSSLSSGSIDTTSPAFIGYGFDSSFVEGQIGVSIGAATLSPGGSTNLTVNIVSSTKTLASAATQITFNSPCIASGEAKLTTPNGGASTNVVSSNFGEATITYTANGCSGTDQITATAVIKGLQTNAKTTLNIASDTVLTVKALDPSNTQISLKGTGGQETSVVSFLVTGSTGAPIKNIAVDFTLSTEAGNASLGGLSLVNNSATSDKNGLVSTTVQAGNIATSVVVTAKARDSGIAAQSKKLIVSTGIPDQDSVSLAATDPYPSGWDHDGIESTFTIRLADAFNNPVSDGTAVSFTAEGGSIDPSCTTEGGACSVVWRSQNPRPVRDSADFSVPRLLCVNIAGSTLTDYATCRRERAGRVTILAHAIGNESFIDNNGNGLYDAGVDTFKTHNDYQNGNPECDRNAPLSSFARPTNSPRFACDDLVEAYLDRNENGVRDNDEPFIDLNLDGAPSVENGIYNGVLCRDNDPSCTNKEKITIRDELFLVMVSDHQLLEPITYLYDGVSVKENRFPFLARNVRLSARPKSSSSTSAAASSAANVVTETKAFFWIADKNGNGAPAGTKISLNTSGLKNASAILTNEGPLPASADPTSVEIRFSSDDSGTHPSGFVKVTVTFPTPNGELSLTDEVDVNNINYP